MTEAALSSTTDSPRSGRLRCHAAKWDSEEDLRYPLRLAKLQASWDGGDVTFTNDALFSSRPRDEWESAVRILRSIPWLKFARRDGVRFDRANLSKGTSQKVAPKTRKLFNLLEKNQDGSPLASRTVYFHTVHLFFPPVWFLIRQNYSRIYDGKRDLGNVLRLIRKIY